MLEQQQLIRDVTGAPRGDEIVLRLPGRAIRDAAEPPHLQGERLRHARDDSSRGPQRPPRESAMALVRTKWPRSATNCWPSHAHLAIPAAQRHLRACHARGGEQRVSQSSTMIASRPGSSPSASRARVRRVSSSKDAKKLDRHRFDSAALDAGYLAGRDANRPRNLKLAEPKAQPGLAKIVGDLDPGAPPNSEPFVDSSRAGGHADILRRFPYRSVIGGSIRACRSHHPFTASSHGAATLFLSERRRGRRATNKGASSRCAVSVSWAPWRSSSYC